MPFSAVSRTFSRNFNWRSRRMWVNIFSWISHLCNVQTTVGPLEPHFRGQGAKMSNRLHKRKWSPWITLSKTLNPFRIRWTVIDKWRPENDPNFSRLCAICCRTEVDNDVISGVVVDNVGIDFHIKLGDSRSNGFRDIRGADFVSNERSNERTLNGVFQNQPFA